MSLIDACIVIGKKINDVLYQMDNVRFNVNEKNDNSQTLLMASCISKIEPIVKKLLENKLLDLNLQDNDGYTALMEACDHRSYNIVSQLIDKKANVDIQDKRGDTALLWACYTSRKIDERIIYKLIDAGANIYVKGHQNKTIFDHIDNNLGNKIINHVRTTYLQQFLDSINEDTKIARSFRKPIADLNLVDMIVSFIV